MCTATVEEKENMYRNSRFAYAGLLFLATLFLFTFVSDDAEADTIDVDSLGGADYTNLSQAVSNANSGDTICELIYPGFQPFCLNPSGDGSCPHPYTPCTFGNPDTNLPETTTHIETTTLPSIKSHCIFLYP